MLTITGMKATKAIGHYFMTSCNEYLEDYVKQVPMKLLIANISIEQRMWKK